MSIEQKIFNLLSPIFEKRVYANIAPQAEIQNNLQPFAVYTIVTETPLSVNGCGDFVTSGTVQIDLYVSSNNFNVIKKRIEFYNLVFDEMKKGGFRFNSNRTSFDNDLRLYRSSSDWNY